MSIEIKVFTYWLTLVILSYIIAKLEYIFSQTNVYYKYHDSWVKAIHEIIKYAGYFLITCYIFMQFTNLFFKGEFVDVTK